MEKVLPPDPGATYPMCVGGKLRCPPEDRGSIPGYYNLLEIICDPTHEGHGIRIWYNIASWLWIALHWESFSSFYPLPGMCVLVRNLHAEGKMAAWSVATLQVCGWRK